MTEINKKGLECPFSLGEMKAHYEFEQLTYQTYCNMKADYDRLIRHNRANGIGFSDDSYGGFTRHIVPEELLISCYIGKIYQFVRHGGPE